MHPRIFSVRAPSLENLVIYAPLPCGGDIVFRPDVCPSVPKQSYFENQRIDFVQNCYIASLFTIDYVQIIKFS